MNLSTLKALIWATSLAVFGYLGWFVYAWAVQGGKDERTATRAPTELMKRVLDDVPEPAPPRTALVDYETVVATFHELNWTGREAPKPVETAPVVVEEPVAATKPDVAKLLRVLYLEVDEADPSSSLTLVQYEEPKLAGQFRTPIELKIGDRLHAPYEMVRVSAITPEGVAFTADGFEDDGPQVVPTWSPFGPGITYVGPEGARMPAVAALPRVAPPLTERPERTVERRPGTYLLGTEDVADIERDYLSILSNEVRHRRYLDPRTRTWGGIEVIEVAPGSVAARHGVRNGDIIKSINGTPVAGPQEAISYVKNNAKLYTTWEVVVENAGKQRTLVYESP